MSKSLLGLVLAGTMVLASASAQAVDIRNDDDAAHEIVLSVWKDQTGVDTTETVIQLAPGEIKSGVCDQCIVSLGKDEDAESVAADSVQLVTIIKGGKLAIE